MRKLIKLNLGSGNDKKSGHINIDIDPRNKPDIIHDLTKKLPFPNSIVSEIILQDVLEHLTKENGQKLLNECGRVLTDNGKITIRVPNIPAILKKFKGQDDLVMLYVYGDTSPERLYGIHKYGYTPQLINEACQKAGIQINKIEQIDTNYSITGCKELVKTGEIVCNNFFSFLKTPFYLFQGKKVIWKINKNYPEIFGKTILRNLSGKVNNIICTRETEKFVKEVLKYSHLKTMVRAPR